MDMEKYDKNVQKTDSEVGTSLSLDSDTTISDFKSPKIKPIEKLKLFDFKLTTKKKNTCKKTDLNKGLNKKTSNQLKKNIFDVHTRTESNTCVEKSEKSESVKLSNDTKVAYVCPLCFKNFKDTNSRILHMKNCAAKNNVSMEKLLQAMELQERQSAERVSLGLLAAPVLQNKKQTTINKMFLAKDHQLQLALALSKSLYEAEEVGNCSEIEDLSDIYLTKDSTKELTDKNLMGNITSRLQKRKKQTFITVLQTRSKEERDRLITEKIAEILIDSGTLDQNQQQTQSKFENIKRNNLRSHILKEYLNLDNKLWNSAMLQPNQEDFYVLNLSPYIIPSTKQMFMESESDSNISNKSEQKDSLPTESNLHSNEKESLNISQKVDIKLFPNAEKEDINIQSSINTLILDWGNALNNSSSSDIIIFVNDDKHIWVHKLVFYVRCSNILLDIIPNTNTAYSVKEMICWTDVEYLTALAFLEFLYCGIIKKYAISFNDNIAISSLGRLARRYKVKELFTYLRLKYSKNNKFELYKQDTQEICNNNKQNEFVEYNMLTSKKDINDVNCSNHSMPDISIMEIPHDKQLKTNMTSSEKCVALVDRENSMSPDIFNDTNDVKLNHTNIEHLNKNIDILLSPIQCNSKNITNQILFSSTINKSRSPIDECILNESLMATSESNPDMADKIKPKSNLTLFIEEVQRENAKSDFASDSEIDSPTKSFIQYNKNPFRKKDYDESSSLNKLHNSKLSPDQPEKKKNCLSKLENDMQIHANENPHLYNITIDKNLTKPTEHNHTDLLSSIREIKTSCSYNDKNFSEKTITNSQVNNVSRTASFCSNSEMDIDDLDMYTKNKRKYTDNSTVVYRSASKKYKNSMTEIKNDEIENNKAIASNSGKVEDEVEIYDTLLNTSFQHTDNFKEQDIDNCNNDSLNTQITSNESCNNDYSNIFNLDSPEISDIENQDDSPLKLSTNPDSIVISSSSDTDINSQDINNFNKNDNFSVLHSKIQESDDELRYTFPNEVHFSNINIDNRTEHISLHNKALQVFSKNKRSRKRCKSEGNLQINYTTEENDKFDKFNNMNSFQSNKEDNHKLIIKNRLFTIIENNDTSPPNYDVMDTAELYREMQKYGLKGQNRNKTIKLLTYIYNELHPTIDSCETIDTSAKNMYNEHEEPQKKRLKVDINLSDKYSNIERECNISPLKNWNSNDHPIRMESAAEYSNNVENLIALSDCHSIKEAFSKLIEFNKDLHNKILQYEPLNIELLHHMLKTNGFKCKINALIDFLDEQRIKQKPKIENNIIKMNFNKALHEYL